jgi:sugar phosphate isomerase/epimerase
MLAALLALALPACAADLFARENLVAWCIVPFDAQKRGPEQRAEMLLRLGIRRLAYDYRAEHIPTWDAELAALKKHGIALTAWWFPTTLNDEARAALDLFRRHGVTPQLWVTGGGSPVKTDTEQAARVEQEAARLRPIAAAAAPLGCQVALYNHGGWFGEPENQIAIIERLAREGINNVGLVYNLHHGHAHLDRFPALLEKMKPHLLALNLNGMTKGADAAGRKIMVLGAGEEDARLLRAIRDSRWHGPIGILNHTEEDAETRLAANLAGLEKLLTQP